MRKLNIKTVFILIITSMVVFSSCYKEKKKDPVYIDAEFKNHFNYKDGTYWIFYDSVSGNIDSLIAGGNTTFAPFEGSNRADDNLERIGMGMVLYNTVNDSIISIWEPEIAAPAAFNLYIPDLQFSGTLLYGWPITKNQTSNDFLNAYIDNANTYNNVYVRKSKYDPYYDVTFYLTTDGGFITILLRGNGFPNTSLHLLRYNINI